MVKAMPSAMKFYTPSRSSWGSVIRYKRGSYMVFFSSSRLPREAADSEAQKEATCRLARKTWSLKSRKVYLEIQPLKAASVLNKISCKFRASSRVSSIPVEFRS